MDRKDVEETARLLLMDMVSDKQVSYHDFHKRMQTYYERSFPIPVTQNLFAKYMGWNRSIPTHDLETGQRKM
jgi:hypothetical protein